jgi:hypothetical protein
MSSPSFRTSTTTLNVGTNRHINRMSSPDAGTTYTVGSESLLKRPNSAAGYGSLKPSGSVASSADALPGDLVKAPSAGIPSCKYTPKELDVQKISDSDVRAEAMINICNTILGSGMLAMPGAMASLGLIPGALAICLSGAASAFGLILLARSAESVGRQSSFNSLCLITYPRLAVFFDLAIAIKCFGVGISYLIIIGDLMPTVAKTLFGLDFTRQFWITVFMSLVIPFSYLKRLDSLKYTSFLALTAVAYLMVLVLYFFFHGTDEASRGNVRLFDPQLRFLGKLPIFVFAFTCHQNVE